ncbi:MAG TPA: DoxX family protein, partial [Chitinophagaceae bacterium]|nr:DoxX family protein [Chitinophagaceae bacterium]
MKHLITVIRVFVALVFIASGLVKANDPLGLSYKMQEFFEVWGFTTLHFTTLPA